MLYTYANLNILLDSGGGEREEGGGMTGISLLHGRKKKMKI